MLLCSDWQPQSTCSRFTENWPEHSAYSPRLYNSRHSELNELGLYWGVRTTQFLPPSFKTMTLDRL